MHANRQQQAETLTTTLGLAHPPLAIVFSDEPLPGVAAFEAEKPPATADGRTGAVPAGCVFWMHAAERMFSTVAADHANCSVGSVTHGFLPLAEAAGRADVAAIVEAGWVTPEIFPQIPAVSRAYRHVSYGPLADCPVEPGVVLLRLHARQAMVLSDAVPGLRFEGKPQCHIVPMALEAGEVAVSVGCMLSRVRTGMSNHEMTCAIPGDRLDEVLAKVVATSDIDRGVAAYAAEDAKRFRTPTG